MADVQQNEQSQCSGVSGLLRAEIVPENAGNSALSPLPENFDKEVFLEEVRKYRCLWDVNSEGYKMRPMKQNAWLQISAIFNRDGKFKLANTKNELRSLCSVLFCTDISSCTVGVKSLSPVDIYPFFVIFSTLWLCKKTRNLLSMESS